MHLSKISLALRQWGAGGGFSPLSLFASGEQGAWYDPSDLSTMFQDAEGTTPVTAVGQPVGLILDKSKGLVLGPELVTNGNFSVGTGWTLSGTTTISGGLLNAASPGSEFIATQSVPFVSGKTYELTIVVPTITSGNVSVVYGVGTNVTAITVVSSGTFKSRVAAGSGNSELRLVSSGSGFTGTIDNISIKELPGNHASQATAAACPLLQNDGVNNYIAFDGVDDALATASIDFTSTDKLSVFGGFRKIDDTARMLCELSPNGGVVNGTFYMVSGTDLGFLTYSSLGHGSTVAGVSTTAGTSVGSTDDTAVLSATHDISGDLSTLRRNAVAGTSGTGDKGTANFSNNPLYIGARAASSVFFNGRLYSLIVLGRLATTQEITDTEQWVAGKTGVVLP